MSNRVVTIIQARVGSTRLPGKVLMPLGGETALERVIERAALAEKSGQIVVATTVASGDDAIARLCDRIGVPVYRGSEQDVLDRYYRAAVEFRAETVVRVTSDCPLLDPAMLDEAVRTLWTHAADYVFIEPTPRGLPAEAISMSALSAAWTDASDANDREHVTLYILNHPELFRVLLVEPSDPTVWRADLRLTLDTPDDYRLLSAVYNGLGADVVTASTTKIMAFVEADPVLRALAQEVAL